MPSRLLLFCALLTASASSVAMTLYRTTDAYGVVSYSEHDSEGAKAYVIFREPIVERLDGQVRLNSEVIAGGVRFSAHNELFAPVEVELRLQGLSNAQGGNAPRIVRKVLPARSTQLLSVIMAQPGKQLGYQSKLDYALGSPLQRPQAFRYPFPWRGGPFRLSQGPNGRYSHFGAKGRYAMDIAMPEGTPVIAARAGVVVKIGNDQLGRGPDPSGNFVRVQHDDGTQGVYLHRKRGSVSVRAGQRVAVGSPLALSGNTGNSSGPHLHFVVQRATEAGLVSIPYEFNLPVGTLPNFALGK